MFKLYKKLRPIDWVLLAVLVGLTFLQVYCTMTLVDFMKEVIQAITYLDYHNNPGKLGAALKELVDLWSAGLRICGSPRRHGHGRGYGG